MHARTHARRTCEHNPNKAFASCSVPQELTNEEIDALEAAGGSESQEDEEVGFSCVRLCTCLPFTRCLHQFCCNTHTLSLLHRKSLSLMRWRALEEKSCWLSLA